MELNENDIKLRLVSGVPIVVEGIGQLYLPTVKEVIGMTELKYQSLLTHLLFDKKSIDYSEDLDQYSDFEVLLMYINHNDSALESFFNAFKLFFTTTPNLHEKGIIYFGELTEESLLTEEKMKYVQKILKLAHFYEEKEEEKDNYANSIAKKMAEKLRKSKAAQIPQKQNLHSMLSALGWKTFGVEKILHKTIYQLYNGLRTIDNIDSFHYIQTGIHAGTINGEKIKLSDIHWANIIK